MIVDDVSKAEMLSIYFTSVLLQLMTAICQSLIVDGVCINEVIIFSATDIAKQC